MLANDSDPDGDALTLAQASVDQGTVVVTGKSLTFTPAAGFTGTAIISYLVSDGLGGTAQGQARVQVLAAPEEHKSKGGSLQLWSVLLLGLAGLFRRRLR
ncbi:cadherin-like domain-containing protein [Gallaecimonas kandeliae]|uniref:cadherin-like domain-containing protein n=1 Tax=Gallaecimonas kandeliae TaxID=3029055 RepID=UPI002648FC96|nr:cadherin-like domain-containing protein [Gallaecimonas kandeliae]WKE64562.1 cadherin-like domain-containing protein [Gallaecimonas kandeliae]